MPVSEHPCELDPVLVKADDWWPVEIEGMPDFSTSMKRVYAWYQNQILDRPPVRFIAHNAFLEAANQDISALSRQEKEDWWFNTELQVDLFERSVAGHRFHGETFPVFFPNLGPDVYALTEPADFPGVTPGEPR
jgi:hypothetical protein